MKAIYQKNRTLTDIVPRRVYVTLSVKNVNRLLEVFNAGEDACIHRPGDLSLDPQEPTIFVFLQSDEDHYDDDDRDGLTFDIGDVPPDGVLMRGAYTDVFVTGHGLSIHGVHSKGDCGGEPCTIHNPSNHHMRSFPTVWSRGMMQRICPDHDEYHVDPDEVVKEYGGCRCKCRCCDGE